MRRAPKQKKETKTVTLSDEPQIQGIPPAIFANPYKEIEEALKIEEEVEESYQTAWSRMLAEKDRQKQLTYRPATDDLAVDDRHPDPLEDQGDGRDAYGNAVPGESEDYLAWCEEMGLRALEGKVAAKTGEMNDNKEVSQVLVFKDHSLDYPELYLNVFLVGPELDTKGFPFLFARAWCTQAKDIHDADLVVFTGGPDVDPSYYGEEAHCTFWGNEERDYVDLAAYMTCLEEGIPMLGVCRGAQFLAVMGGCKLVQDIDNHQTDHSIWDRKKQVKIDKVSSRHHQSVIPGPGMEVIATAQESTKQWTNPKTLYDKSTMKSAKYPLDIEAFFLRETCAIGIQGHPEYKGYNAFSKWSLELINEYVLLNEDIDWVNNRRRIKKEFVEERKLVSDKERRQILSLPSSVKEN